MAKTERKSFVFYEDWYKAISDLNDKERLEIYDAIMSTVFENGQVELSGVAGIAMKFIKQQLERDMSKWLEIKTKRAESGRLGGLSKAKQNVANVANAKSAKQKKQNVANVAVNVNDNVNIDNNNVNLVNSKEENINIKEEKGVTKDTISERKDKFYKSLIPYLEKYPKEMIREFFDYWSEPNRSNTKMRFELEKTWETNRRLSTWSKRSREKEKLPIGMVLRDNSQEKFKEEKLW